MAHGLYSKESGCFRINCQNLTEGRTQRDVVNGPEHEATEQQTGPTCFMPGRGARASFKKYIYIIYIIYMYI